MPIMKDRAQTTIDRSADDIWARIGNFVDISWIPGTEPEKCTMEGNLRTTRREAWKFELVQRLTEQDDKEHIYSYDLPAEINFESLIGPGKIVRVLNGTLKVTEIGDGQSHVTWDLETEDFLFPGAFKEYQLALDTVKAQMEG